MESLPNNPEQQASAPEKSTQEGQEKVDLKLGKVVLSPSTPELKADKVNFTPTQEQATSVLEGLRELFRIPGMKKSIAAKIAKQGVTKDNAIERDAKSLIPIVDEMLATKDNYEIKYSDYIAYYTANTLWIKISKGRRHLIEIGRAHV